MSAYKFTSHRQLRNLLNDAELKQKKDISQFAGGHLNESLLFKPQSEWACAKWTAGKDTKILTQQKSDIRTKSRQDNKKMKNVLNVLYDFSVGTSGSLPIQSKKQSLRRKSDLQGQDSRPVSTRKDISPASRKSIYSELNDGVLVEELKAEEMMLPHPLASVSSSRKKQIPEDYDVLDELTERLDHDGYLTFRHTFLPSHHTGVTKKDQFVKMKQFESGILRKQDSSEQNVLSGARAVEHLEKKLKEVSYDL